MWVVVENVRGFVLSRPPLVLFTLLLGVFAVILLSLGRIVTVADLRNPDEVDWNDFLSGFKDVQFCMVTNNSAETSTDASEHIGAKPIKDVVADVHNKLHASTVGPGKADPDEIVMVSFPFWVEVQPTPDFVNIPHNVSHLSTSMNGKQLGLKGINANTDFNVTMTLPFQWERSICGTGGVCNIVKILTCMELEAPARLFPKRNPNMCQLSNHTGGVENNYKMVSKKKSDVRPRDIVCDSYPSLTVNHDNDPKLTIMLTLQDKSAITLHLMHTSFFLFVMIIVVLCYAMVRGKPHMGKNKGKNYTQVVTQL